MSWYSYILWGIFQLVAFNWLSWSTLDDAPWYDQLVAVFMVFMTVTYVWTLLVMAEHSKAVKAEKRRRKLWTAFWHNLQTRYVMHRAEKARTKALEKTGRVRIRRAVRHEVPATPPPVAEQPERRSGTVTGRFTGRMPTMDSVPMAPSARYMAQQGVADRFMIERAHLVESMADAGVTDDELEAMRRRIEILFREGNGAS